MRPKTSLACMLALAWAVPHRSLGSFEASQAGARYAGMGGAGIAVITGSEALFGNPAGMPASGPELAFFCSNPYNLEGLFFGAVSAVVPTRVGGFGIGVKAYGLAVYRETTLAAGWAEDFGDRLVCGVSLRACHLAIRGYGSAAACAVDAGCIIRLNHQTEWGLSFSNLNQARLGRSREVLPQHMRTGFSFAPKPGVLLALELDKDTRFPLQFRGGCEIAIHPRFFLRCGFGSDPSLVAAGIGVDAGRILLDYAFVLHPILGVTHQASLTLGLGTRRGMKPGRG